MAQEFKPGDRVKVVAKMFGGCKDFQNAWVEEMDNYVGNHYTVARVHPFDGVYFREDGETYAFPPGSLEPVAIPFTIKTIGLYRTRGGLQVKVVDIHKEMACPVIGVLRRPASSTSYSYEVRTWSIDGRISTRHPQNDDIVGPWVEPHPLEGTEPGTPIWVRNKGDSWKLRIFKRLLTGDLPMVVCEQECSPEHELLWDEGKPVVKGVRP